MDIKVQLKHALAKMPNRQNPNDAGADLYAASMSECAEYVEYDTGLSIELPEGYVGLIFPRSSLSNYSLTLSNSVGVLDFGYSGTIKFRFNRANKPFREYGIGDRIGQIIIMPIPEVSFKEVVQISGDRSGYGSTGIN